MLSTLIIVIISLLSSAFASDDIAVHSAWIRSAPPKAKVLAAYMKIINKSSKTRYLIGVSSSLFGKVEMHRTGMHGEIMKMVYQKRLTLHAGGLLELKPGGYHLMLKKPESVPQPGEQVTLTLQFENGQTVEVTAPVLDAKGGDMHDMQPNTHSPYSRH